MVLSPWGREAPPFPKAWPWKLSPLQLLQEGKRLPGMLLFPFFRDERLCRGRNWWLLVCDEVHQAGQ